VDAWLETALALPRHEWPDFVERCRRQDADAAAELASLLAAAPDVDTDDEAPRPAWLPATGTVQAPAPIGAWRFLRPLGSGASAEVWLARRDDGAQPAVAAVKLLDPRLRHVHLRERLQQEGALLARLEHPHIAGVIEAGVTVDDRAYLVLEYIDGEDVLSHCRARDLDAPARVHLLLQLTDALAYAHRNLVVHRDVKPANVLVDAHGRIRLLDFGIARLLDPADDVPRTHTVWRAFTPEFAAPEQIAGAPTTTAVDIFAAGMLLQCLLGGKPDRSRPSTRETVAGADRDLFAIARRATRDEPEARYATIDALAADLRAWLEGRPLAARRGERSYVLRKFVRRHRAGTALGVLAVIALGVSWVVNIQARSAAEAAAQRALATQQFLRDTFAEANPRTRGGRPSRIEDVLATAAATAGRRFEGNDLLRAEVLAMVGELQALNFQSEPAASTLEQAIAAAQRAGPAARPVLRNAQLLRSASLVVSGRAEDAEAALVAWLGADTALRAESPATWCRAQSTLADARARTAPAAAEAALRGALEVCRGVAGFDPGSAARAARTHANLLRNLERPAEAAVVLEAAEAGLAAADPHASHWYELASLKFDRAGIAGTLGRADEQAALTRQSYALFERHTAADSNLRADPLLALGAVQLREGDLAGARASFEEALRLRERDGDQAAIPQRVRILTSLGWGAWEGGDRQRAADDWRRALALLATPGQAPTLDAVTLNSNLAEAAWRSGDGATALAHADAALAALEATGARRDDLHAVALFVRCMARAVAGDVDALGDCDRGIAMDRARASDDIALLADGQRYLADAAIRIGDTARARGAAESVLSMSGATDALDVELRVHAHVLAGLAALAARDASLARRRLEQADAIGSAAEPSIVAQRDRLAAALAER
jgi:serine/threonine-protein kinase